MDIFSPAQRSAIMSRIRGRDTGPELRVRRYLHAAGFRFRLYRRDLPGRPDIVLPARRICVFVHGCFWHGCPRCFRKQPAVRSNADYWRAKLSNNRRRDRRNKAALEAMGWRVIEIWECRTKNPESLAALVAAIRAQASECGRRERGLA